MTDKELLELAAKAHGIKAVWAYDKAHNCLIIDSFYGRKIWNPIEHDGDALRLAVKLGIDLKFFTTNFSVSAVQVNYFDGKEERHINVGIDEIADQGNPYAATRRAIVRAAAEIGKEMK